MDTLDDMSPQDWRDVYEGFQSGLWGPFKDYNVAYGNYAYLHSISSSVIRTANSKNKVDKFPQFGKIFPTILEYQILGQSSTTVAPKQEYELDLALGLMQVNSGAPQWLIDAVTEK